MIVNPVVQGNGGSAFTGVANITYKGTRVSAAMSYMDNSLQLMQVVGDSNLPSTIPVPQIIYAAIPGRRDGMSISGNYTLIASIPSPATARMIYVYGDITITSS